MADQVSEILEAPKEFVHDGMQFSELRRCVLLILKDLSKRFY